MNTTSVAMADVDEQFRRIEDGCHLPPESVSQLADDGFVIVPGPVPQGNLPDLVSAYDEAMVTAVGTEDHRVGSTTTRLFDLVNRGAAFDSIYVHALVLEAAASVVGRPFRLGMLLGRTLHPDSAVQELHVDLTRDDPARPMVGFILMIDAFRPDNGATRIVPGSHRWKETPQAVMSDPRGTYAGEVLACGAAGALLIFDASVWHGHTANITGVPRRSIQGYFIPREAHSGFDFRVRMNSETVTRISPLAKYVLGLDGRDARTVVTRTFPITTNA